MNLALISESTGGLLWIVWFGSSLLIGLGGIAYFRIYPDVNLKRRFHRWFTIGYGAAFFLLMLLSMDRWAWAPLVLFGVGIAVITYLNIRSTVFCNACGKPTFNYSWFSKIEYCARCGARLPQNTRA